MERIVGKLQRVVAVGGETTGWAIQMEAEQKIGNIRLKQIEVDPAPRKIQLGGFLNKRVEVTGRLISRQGVERGERPVIVIETIQELEKR